MLHATGRSGETKTELFDNQHTRWVRHKNKDGYRKKNPTPTVKYSGDFMVLLGCVSSKGLQNLVRIHGIKDSMMYHWILIENLAASAKKLQLGCG